MNLKSVRDLKMVMRKQLLGTVTIQKILAMKQDLLVAFGIGWRRGAEGGEDDYLLTVRIRASEPQAPLEAKIRRVLRKLGVDDYDLRYTGRVRALRLAALDVAGTPSRLMIGSSVSLKRRLGGTLGFFARSRGDGTRGFVSANHVIANLGRHVLDNTIVSPVRSENRIGELVRFTCLGGGGEKHTDAAFAKLDDSVRVDRSSLPEGRTLSAELALPEETTRVMKLGMVTNFTRGNVTSFDQDTFSTRYATVGEVDFEDQIEVESAMENGVFAAFGDSGALVYNDAGRAVGLLFATTEAGLSYVNPIQFVLDELKVDLDVEP
jgi:hypothetical protein